MVVNLKSINSKSLLVSIIVVSVTTIVDTNCGISNTKDILSNYSFKEKFNNFLMNQTQPIVEP